MPQEAIQIIILSAKGKTFSFSVRFPFVFIFAFFLAVLLAAALTAAGYTIGNDYNNQALQKRLHDLQADLDSRAAPENGGQYARLAARLRGAPLPPPKSPRPRAVAAKSGGSMAAPPKKTPPPKPRPAAKPKKTVPLDPAALFQHQTPGANAPLLENPAPPAAMVADRGQAAGQAPKESSKRAIFERPMVLVKNFHIHPAPGRGDMDVGYDIRKVRKDDQPAAGYTMIVFKNSPSGHADLAHPETVRLDGREPEDFRQGRSFEMRHGLTIKMHLESAPRPFDYTSALIYVYGPNGGQPLKKFVLLP
jgi:hypothetical protein